jgi:hypothetical protein
VTGPGAANTLRVLKGSRTHLTLLAAVGAVGASLLAGVHSSAALRHKSKTASSTPSAALERLGVRIAGAVTSARRRAPPLSHRSGACRGRWAAVAALRAVARAPRQLGLRVGVGRLVALYVLALVLGGLGGRRPRQARLLATELAAAEKPTTTNRGRCPTSVCPGPRTGWRLSWCWRSWRRWCSSEQQPRLRRLERHKGSRRDMLRSRRRCLGSRAEV